MHSVEIHMFVKKSRKELKTKKSQIKHGAQSWIASWMFKESRDEMEIMCVQLYHRTLKTLFLECSLAPAISKTG